MLIYKDDICCALQATTFAELETVDHTQLTTAIAGV